MARLKPGVTMEQASADVARMIPVALESFPPFPGYNKKMFFEARLAPLIKPLKQNMIGDIGGVLWVLMGTIGAGAADRTQQRHESVARQSGWASTGTGDSRSWRGLGTQIARELLMESVMLGLFGGVAGLALAYGGLQLLVAIAPSNLPRIEEISIDRNVLLFTLAFRSWRACCSASFRCDQVCGPQLAPAREPEAAR